MLLWRVAQSRELTEISFLSSALSLFLVLRDKKFMRTGIALVCQPQPAV